MSRDNWSVKRLKPDHDFEIVQEQPHLKRDTYSKAILNNDSKAYDIYMNAALKRKERHSQLDKQEREINNIKGELSEVKELLGQMLNKVNGN